MISVHFQPLIITCFGAFAISKMLSHLKYFYSGQMPYNIAEEKNSCKHANQRQTSDVKH